MRKVLIVDDSVSMRQMVSFTLRQGGFEVVEAEHGCMSGRGVRTHGVGMITSRMLGCFRDDPASRREILSLMGR